ncbi:MAG: hypothetical protein H0X24_08840, partial [Ktedonobacterales bacterium]|nr:hypothetical protein [Ktedonobacterales bacterium]
MANAAILRVRSRANVVVWKALSPLSAGEVLAERAAQQRAQQGLRDAIARVADTAPAAFVGPALPLDAAQAAGARQSAEQREGRRH